MDSDDEIELLKSPPSEESESHRNSNYQHQSSVNPGFVFQSRGSQEESSTIDPGSLHALQTAFTSLQKKHNEQTKKYQELSQRHILMQKNLAEPRVMDPTMVNNSAAGAGASYDEEATNVTAEVRASQGYIQHLERGLLRSHNSVTKGNAEIERLKQKLSEVDSLRQTWILDRDTLQYQIENLSDSLRLTKAESVHKDEKIVHLEESLHTLTVQNQVLHEENSEMKRQIESSERTSQISQSKDNEILELQTRLRAAEVEKQRFTNNYRELEKCMSDKNLEISALEAKYKQYAIENDINRKHVQAQVQRGTDSSDEVDGEAEMMEKVGHMIGNLQQTIQELKYKVDKQKVVISELCKTKAVKFHPENSSTDYSKNIEVREAAQGASFHLQMNDEKSNKTPIYVNYAPNINLSPSISPKLPLNNVKQVSPVPSLSRQSCDKDNYRGFGGGSQPNSPRTNEIVQPLMVSPRTNDVVPTIISPRINDSVKPTGNVNVPRMIASEQSQPLVCFDDRNVIDAQRPGASPQGQNRTVINNETRDFSRRNLGEYNTSPSNFRKSSPSYVNDEQEETGVLDILSPLNYGARPRVLPGDASQSNLPNNSAQMTAFRIPDRMTQSEIIVRGNSPSNRDNNIFQPMPPLDIPCSSSRSLENINIPGQGQMYETNSRYHHQRSTSQPDYENVYETRNERQTESPNNDYDHSIYVNNTNIMMPNRIAVEHQAQQVELEEGINSVSAIKICPSCNVEFSRLTMDQFQRHVFECFDTFEEPPATLQPGGNPSEEDRTCPMCGANFPVTIPQETYEQHVLAHFGEEPLIDGYEMLN